MKTITELSKDEKIRYRGHLSLCEIDVAGQQRLAESRVLIVGTGGLRKPCGSLSRRRRRGHNRAA